MVIFNQGDTPLRVDLIVGTLLPDGAAVSIQASDVLVRGSRP